MEGQLLPVPFDLSMGLCTEKNTFDSLFLQFIYEFFHVIFPFNSTFLYFFFLGSVATYQPSCFVSRFCFISLSPLSYKLPKPVSNKPGTIFSKGLLVPQELSFHFAFSNTHFIPCHFASIRSCHLYYNKSFLS